MSELRWDGRVAVITGAGRGIGREHALLLAARGAQVVVNDLGVETDGSKPSSTPTENVVAEITAAGGQATVDAHSVASREAAEAIVHTAVDTFGRIDVLIHNAGLVNVGLDELLDIHLRGGSWLAEAAWPVMRQQGFGRILFTTSSAGLFGFPSGPDYVPMQSYGAAKMGLVGLMRALSHRGAMCGITVNALAPTAVSRMDADAPGREEMSAEMRQAIESSAARRAPALVAAAAAFLVHETCSATGEIYGAGAGQISRIFVGETAGYRDPAITPEKVRDHFDEIRDETGYVVPGSIFESIHVLAAAGTLPTFETAQ